MHLVDRVNLGRRLFEDGNYREAVTILEDALAEIEGATHTLDASEIEYTLDIVTLMALALREVGDVHRALSLLTNAITARLPQATDLSQVLRRIGDPERRQVLVVGQFCYWEMCAEYLLAPTQTLRSMLKRISGWVRASEIPMLEIYLGYARACMRRLSGDLRGAARDFVDVARSTADGLRRGMHAAGHTPAWSYCQALVTIEAQGGSSNELMEHLHDFDRTEDLRLGFRSWERVFITGLRYRLSLTREPFTESTKTEDLLLKRLRADAWLSSKPRPTDRDCNHFLECLADAPPACKVSYLWRALLRIESPLLNDALDAELRMLKERREINRPLARWTTL